MFKNNVIDVYRVGDRLELYKILCSDRTKVKCIEYYHKVNNQEMIGILYEKILSLIQFH